MTQFIVSFISMFVMFWLGFTINWMLNKIDEHTKRNVDEIDKTIKSVNRRYAERN